MVGPPISYYFCSVIHVLALLRIIRFSEIGLNVKWNEKTKRAHNDFKITMRMSGKPASCSSTFCLVFPWASLNYVISFSTQVPPVEVELSDEPELAPLTLTHVFGPVVLHVLILALASLVWMGELCLGFGQRRGRIERNNRLWNNH